MSDQSRVPVYVVCEAEYDARAVVAVFTNAAAAERHAADCREAHGGEYEVIPSPLLGVVPQRTNLYIHAGRVWIDGSQVREEQTWTVDKWDYQLPAQPVITVDARRPEAPRIHVAAATAEAAAKAFREAVAGGPVQGELRVQQ